MTVAFARRLERRTACVALAWWLVGAKIWAAPARIVVDADRGEVRLPSRFVNPSRILEVFACDKSGPTHETVLEFDASRADLVRSLLEIGCRSASYWNGTSPTDFEKNQGDRILVLLRWEHGGKIHERTAEGILTDGETGFPMFVRAFSFGARGSSRVEPMNDGGEEAGGDRGGEGVEISLGAAMRQSPPQAILTHPTCSKILQPWMLSPFLDTRVVENHRELIDKMVPVTLILRRIKSEAELVEIARESARGRGLTEADALHDATLLIAREIDSLKSQYEALLGELRSALEATVPARGEKTANLAAGERVEELLRRGRWLCAKIEERYLSLYGLEEAHKTAWVEKQKEMPGDVREQALVLARDGFRFEPLLARKRVELEDLDLPHPGETPGELNLRRNCLNAEVEALELERRHLLTLANVRYVETRLEESKNDPYVRRLFEEDWLRQKAIASQYAARWKVAQTEIRELRGLLDGTWEAMRPEVVRVRERAREELECGKIDEQLAVLLEEFRYAEADAESPDHRRKADADKKLLELGARKTKLEEDVRARRAKLEAK